MPDTAVRSSSLSPEAGVLLEVMRSAVGVTRVNTSASLHNSISDWDFFLELACRNHVAISVYRNRGHELLRGMTAQSTEALREQYLGMVQHGLRLATIWREVATALNAARLRTLPYKGRALAADLYGDAAARDTWDIDVLLESPDAARHAYEVLRPQGFLIDLPPAITSVDEVLRQDCELTLVHEESGVAVELHWRLLPSVFGDTGSADFMWAEAKSNNAEGVPCWTATPDATMRMLLLHGGVKHDWSELRLVVDVAQWLQLYGQNNIDAIVDTLPPGTLREKCSAGLVLANRLFHVPVPPSSRSAQAQAALAMGRIFGRNLRLPTFAEWRVFASWLQESGDASGPSLIQYLSALAMPEYEDWRASRRLARLWRGMRLGLKAARLRAGKPPSPHNHKSEPKSQ